MSAPRITLIVSCAAPGLFVGGAPQYGFCARPIDGFSEKDIRELAAEAKVRMAVGVEITGADVEQAVRAGHSVREAIVEILVRALGRAEKYEPVARSAPEADAATSDAVAPAAPAKAARRKKTT